MLGFIGGELWPKLCFEHFGQQTGSPNQCGCQISMLVEFLPKENSGHTACFGQ